MARAEDPTARAQRLIPLATVGLLAFATALAFGRVFVGRGPTLRLVAAALLAVAIGWATDRRGLFLATVASLVGLAFALAWLVFPQTAWYGLPTLRTLRAIGRSLEFVGQQTRTQVSPSPPLAPLMMAAVTAVWAAAFSAYTLAVRAGSPVLAVIAPIALVAFADVVLEDGVRPLYAGVFLVAAVSVIFTDGIRRIRQWGPVWSGPHRDPALRSAAGRGVRRVVLAALGAALLLPWILPGFRSEALVDLTGAGGDAVRLDPFVSIHASLNRDEPIDVLRVTTDGPGSYWRMIALDEFDGAEWSMTDPNLDGAQTYASPARLPTAFPDDAEPLEQRFEVLNDLGDRWVPLAYPAEVVSLPSAAIRYDPSTGMAQAPDPLEEGDAYEVTSRRVMPTPEELDAVAFGAPAEYGQYTFLPGDVPPEVHALAERWTDGEPTPYRQVLAIQERLRNSSFTYDKTVQPEAGADALVEFLTVTKTGFCQQFSAAMAVLVRELGYPSRVAVGYKQGTLADGAFTVRSTDAHSWVEVLFPGYGWLPFEPTPGNANPVGEPGTYLDPLAPGDDGQGPGGAQAGQEAGGQGLERGLPPQIRNVEFFGGRRGGPLALPSIPPAGSAPAEPGYAIPYGTILTVALVLLAALLVLVPLAKAIWRFRVLHRHRAPRETVLAVYRVFDGEAADLGLGRLPGETLAEYERRITASVRLSDGHLQTLTRATMRAAYARDPIEPEVAQRTTRAARTAIRDMRRSTGLVRRVTGIYRPGV